MDVKSCLWSSFCSVHLPSVLPKVAHLNTFPPLKEVSFSIHGKDGYLSEVGMSRASHQGRGFLLGSLLPGALDKASEGWLKGVGLLPFCSMNNVEVEGNSSWLPGCGESDHKAAMCCMPPPRPCAGVPVSPELGVLPRLNQRERPPSSWKREPASKRFGLRPPGILTQRQAVKERWV